MRPAERMGIVSSVMKLEIFVGPLGDGLRRTVILMVRFRRGV
jgi:hypothetical protein